MTPHYSDHSVTLHHGDCLDVLRELPDNSVDAVCTDPPYGLEFMGKEWDRFKATGASSLLHSPKDEGREFTNASGHMWDNTKALPRFPGAGLPFQQWCELWAAECLRVLKPGGHLLAFGGTRTSHRLACAVEDAGFEIRDSIAWLYGSGFPKSLDVSKAIDKAAGAERVVSGIRRGDPGTGLTGNNLNDGPSADAWREARQANGGLYEARDTPATDAARQWQGWGTALKPAFEPIVVARKPLIGTVAANVQAWGTGALNVDACRIGDDLITAHGGGPAGGHRIYNGDKRNGQGIPPQPAGSNPRTGRWPANVVLDESQADALDEMSGELTSGANPTRRGADGTRTAYGDFGGQDDANPQRGADTGGASRFFYTAKASSSERIRLPREGKPDASAIGRKRCAVCNKQAVNVRASSQCQCPEPQWENAASSQAVSHPTVKPLSLMRWLVRLVCPPGGTVLEPFAGSGTTVEACILEGLHCIAIEREADYLPLIVQRVNRQRDPIAYTATAGEDLGLFGLEELA